MKPQKLSKYSRETDIKFQINRGSAKTIIQNQVKFELRLYKNAGGKETYEIIDTNFSLVYRIFTHSTQLEKKRKTSLE